MVNFVRWTKTSSIISKKIREVFVKINSSELYLFFVNIVKGHPESKRHMFKNDSVELIFRLGGEHLLDAEQEGYVEDEDEDEVNEVLEDKDFNERFEVFSKYHNSIVGHFVVGNTLKTMSLWGDNGRSCKKTLSNGSKNVRFVRKSSCEKVQCGGTR